MKQTTKTILHSSFHMLLFGSVIFAVALTHHEESPVAPVEIQAEQTRSLATEQQPSTEHKNDTTVAPSHQAETASKPLPAPKQDTIAAEVTREYTYRMFATPNDPGYSGGSWSLAKINAEAAWNISTGNKQTVVAVIDSGVALAHEDLVDQWHINSGETGMTQSGGRCWTGSPEPKQSNNCDDDANGYADDWQGWNFVLHDNNPQTGRQNTSGTGVRHGTEVAGIVGARGNNGIGVAALNWNTSIMPLQALSDDGVGYTSGITAAIYYAVDNGAQVINLSLGTYANDPAMKAAISYATVHGVVVVAASGNCGEGGSPAECADVPVGATAYPATYPEVIAVGATTSLDQRASFSSYGQALDVVAPGYAVPASTSWSAANQTSLYSGSLYGTSFAAPQVASLAALIKSIRPSTTVADITALIAATTSKPSSMNGALYSTELGHGVINASTALMIASSLNTAPAAVSLLQTGSVASEHTIGTNVTLSSACTATTSSPCTIQAVDSRGYVRYLPYATITTGNAGWSWSSNALDSGAWQLRARSGENVSSTPYQLIKKG